MASGVKTSHTFKEKKREVCRMCTLPTVYRTMSFLVYVCKLRIGNEKIFQGRHSTHASQKDIVFENAIELTSNRKKKKQLLLLM